MIDVRADDVWFEAAGVFLITAGIHNGVELRAALDAVVANAHPSTP